MEVVIDSNVFFRTLISKGEILDIMLSPLLSLLAPERLKEEFLKHRSEILNKTKLSEEEFNELAAELFRIIEFVSFEKYKPFIQKARELLKEHTKDEEFIALCLYKNAKLWTYELLLFKIGFGISTEQISKALSEKV